MPSSRVIPSLEQVIELRGKPSVIQCDNDPEYVSNELVTWVKNHQITLLYIQPEKPT